MVKKVFSILLTVCVLAGLVACNPKTSPNAGDNNETASSTPAEPATPKASEPAETTKDPVTISFGMWDEVQFPVYEEVVKKFMADNPNITVEMQLTPWSQYWTKLDAAAGAKNAPDVYWMNVYMPKYVDAGVVESLETYLDNNNVDRTQWAEGSMQMYNYNGVQYALPINSDSVVVAYNKTIFDKYGVEYPKEGWTWDDMVAIGADLKDKIQAAGGGEYPMVMELDAQPSYAQFMTQEGVDTYSDDGKTNGFAEPGTIKAFEDIVALMDEKIMPEFKVLSDTKGTDLFLSEKAAMVYIGSWKAIVLDESSIAKNIGLVTMPKKENNKCAVGGISYVLSAHTDKKDAAWELLNYLAGAETSKVLAEARLIMPACVGAQEYYAPQFVNIPGQVFVDQANISARYPFHPGMTQWEQDITDYTTKIFNQEMTAEEGCTQLATIIQEKLDEYNAK